MVRPQFLPKGANFQSPPRSRRQRCVVGFCVSVCRVCTIQARQYWEGLHVTFLPVTEIGNPHPAPTQTHSSSRRGRWKHRFPRGFHSFTTWGHMARIASALGGVEGAAAESKYSSMYARSKKAFHNASNFSRHPLHFFC